MKTTHSRQMVDFRLGHRVKTCLMTTCSRQMVDFRWDYWVKTYLKTTCSRQRVDFSAIIGSRPHVADTWWILVGSLDQDHM